MKIPLLIILVLFVQLASGQKQNRDKQIVGSWKFEVEDNDTGITYSGLNQYYADGKFESLLTLADHNGEAENYSVQGTWRTENKVIFYQYEDNTKSSQIYEIIDENSVRIIESNPSDIAVLDDVLLKRIP